MSDAPSPSDAPSTAALARLQRSPSLVTRTERLLREAIAAGRYASGQLPTEIELASELGVSRETVRRATEILSAEGLLVKYRRRGTFLQPPDPLPAVPTTTSRLVAFIQAIYPIQGNHQEPTARHINHLLLDGALEAAGERGWDLVVQRATIGQLRDRAMQLATQTPLAGFLFASLGEEKLLRRLAGRGAPMVLVDHDATLAGVSTLRDDSAGGARLAVEHLAAAGHQRIAIAYWRATDLNPWRLQGYRDGLRARNLPRRRAWEILTDLGPGGADEVVARWRSLKPRPTAIYCFNNSLAVDVIAALKRCAIRVPEDVSIVGGGGEDHPELTHHQCDWQAMGRAAIALLEQATRDASTCQHRLMSHEMHAGTTICPPIA